MVSLSERWGDEMREISEAMWTQVAQGKLLGFKLSGHCGDANSDDTLNGHAGVEPLCVTKGGVGKVGMKTSVAKQGMAKLVGKAA